LIGWLDDRRGLSVLLRLSIFSGISIAYAIFRAPTLNGLISPDLGIALSACFLLVMINVTNFMDGIDGMVVVEFVPMSLFFAYLTAGGVMSPLYGFQATIIAGGLLGFFIFNRPKAKIFLGDSGSLVVGFIVGILLLELSEKQGPHAILFLPLYFFCDAGLTLLRRLLRGEAIWKAHREHFYQQAFDNGQSNWSIIIRVALCNIVLCALFYSTTLLPFWACVISLIFALGLMVFLLVSLSRILRIYERKSRGAV
jgi:UDP-N-acetylmuramyl pentapeptide phosphotransferase/UDP-N-acetylglucosamine-1-phosphate transferase